MVFRTGGRFLRPVGHRIDSFSWYFLYNYILYQSRPVVRSLVDLSILEVSLTYFIFFLLSLYIHSENYFVDFFPFLFLVFPFTFHPLLQQAARVWTTSGRWIVGAPLNRFNTAIPVDSLGPLILALSTTTVQQQQRLIEKRTGQSSYLITCCLCL